MHISDFHVPIGGDGQESAERGHVVVDEHKPGGELQAGRDQQLGRVAGQVIAQLLANPQGLLVVEAAHVGYRIGGGGQRALAVEERQLLAVNAIAQPLA